ncbi:MAG: hypothetical protein GX605_03925 [Chloroflexi bacterium]|nr:hypothetical protein [Chloroflexota bacterium]
MLRGDYDTTGGHVFDARTTQNIPRLIIDCTVPVPTPTATPRPDLVATRLEVAQALQDLNNSVRLVTNKRTFVRFHVRSAAGFHPTFATLVAQQGANSTTIYPSNAGSVLARPSPDRGVLNHSFLFELPNGFKQGTVTLTAHLNPVIPSVRNRNPVESNCGNNTSTATVTFESVPTMNLVNYRVGDKLGSTTYYPSSGDSVQMAQWLRRAYPLSSLAFATARPTGAAVPSTATAT